MAKYFREIARRYGYSEDRQEEIYMMGLLHDVGKIVVSDNISNTAHIIGGLVGSVAGYFLNRKAAW